MKCPKCWTDKAFKREISGLSGVLYSALLVVPLKCRQCEHEFCVTRIATIGSDLERPVTVVPSRARQASARRETSLRV